MESNNFWNLIRKRKQTILFVAFLFLLISLAISFISPLEYRASAKLLITQNNNLGDAYSLSRSNQFLSNVLAEVVYSSSFLEQALSAGFNIDRTIFSADQNKNMKKWRQLVLAKSVSDTGMLVINTYHEDKYQASQINQAVAYILQTKNNLYHGLGDKVSVKVIDRTSVSKWPVKPNFILNAVLGIFFGLIAGFCFVYLYPGKELKSRKKEGITLPLKKNYQPSAAIGKQPQAANFPWEEKENFPGEKTEASEKELELPVEEEKDIDSFSGDINNLF
ncbi:MAG: Wzz/FepE/Etk N-terminal domain-containing protein [Patescibacteria group bacterium]|nr:Wzz/FepE/Etk N-terminal domain-containing protein [Patescibacteria group bacterium]